MNQSNTTSTFHIVSSPQNSKCSHSIRTIIRKRTSLHIYSYQYNNLKIHVTYIFFFSKPLHAPNSSRIFPANQNPPSYSKQIYIYHPTYTPVNPTLTIDYTRMTSLCTSLISYPIHLHSLCSPLKKLITPSHLSNPYCSQLLLAIDHRMGIRH